MRISYMTTQQINYILGIHIHQQEMRAFILDETQSP